MASLERNVATSGKNKLNGDKNMDPKTNECGICREHGVIGLSMFVWPEGKFTHICVNCCIELFPTILTMPRNSVEYMPGLNFISQAMVEWRIRGSAADPHYFSRIMCERFEEKQQSTSSHDENEQ